MSTQGLGSLGAILPAYNAARFLDEVITRIQKLHPGLRILVVDDGSSDDSAAVARQAGAEVIVHSPNKGKGEALKTGYRWATEEGLDWVFTMDSDGQHLPEEMQGFLDVAAGGRVDAVVGSRMADVGDMPWIRLMTNRFTSRVCQQPGRTEHTGQPERVSAFTVCPSWRGCASRPGVTTRNRKSWCA